MKTVDFFANSTALVPMVAPDCLHQSVGELVTLAGRTESHFLDIGEGLHDFYRRSTGISTQAKEVLGWMAGDGLAEIHADLTGLSEQMSQHVQEMMQATERKGLVLGELRALLDRLSLPLAGFGKVLKRLQALWVVTRIEHSQLDQALSDQRPLAGDLKNLSDAIATSLGKVRVRVESLGRVVCKAQTEARALRLRQANAADKVSSHARSALARMMDMRQSSAQKAENLARFSEDISFSIGEVVSSIQFHDITRQQVEHVTLALQDLAGALEERMDNPSSENQLSLVGSVVEACGGQAAQLIHSRDEMNGAVHAIVQNLHSLSSSVTDMASDARHTAGMTNGDGQTFFAELRPAVDAVATILAEEATANLQLTSAVDTVAEEVTGTADLIQDIEQVGLVMKTVAINSWIEASNCGSRGAGLGLVSDAVQKISEEVFSYTQELKTGFEEIDAVARGLGEVAQGEGGSRLEQVRALTNDFQALLELLHRKDTDMVSLLQEMDSQSRLLAGDINLVASSVSVHRIFSQVIDRALGHLDGIVRHDPGITANQGLLACAENEEIFKGFAERYTMQSERTIHQASHTWRPAPGNNLAKQTGSGTGRSGRAIQDHDLGDNVELF